MNTIKTILNSLEDQKMIFGDDLFVSLDINNKNDAKPAEASFTIKETPEKVESEMERNLFEENFRKAEKLEELYSMIHTCNRCELSKTRNKFVFGVGNPKADVMLIGEAPGADEDRLGEPFVGRAGKLLTDILKAINFTRDEVYIANILKCRPPGNRNPLPSEMDTCMPYLYKQIELIQPKLILALGLVAATGLLKVKTSLTKLRGTVHELNGVKLMVTYHPAALLRNPNWKKGAWEDVQQFRKLYDEILGVNNGKA